jgi:hypothetical protein
MPSVDCAFTGKLNLQSPVPPLVVVPNANLTLTNTVLPTVV